MGADGVRGSGRSRGGERRDGTERGIENETLDVEKRIKALGLSHRRNHFICAQQGGKGEERRGEEKGEDEGGEGRTKER